MTSDNNGFSNNPFMMGYDNGIFEADEELGFKFPNGEVITSKGFRKFSEIIAKLKFEDIIIINLGDSSTSGWNSNLVSKNTKNKDAAFFSYKTFSDLLEENPPLKVINAGVPGYTSLQGKLFLQKIFKMLSKNNLKADYVTIYFGNNDSTFNRYEDKVKLQGKNPSLSNPFGFRVVLEDFKKNMQEIIEMCDDYGAKPLLIMPLQNLNWAPGIRSDKHKEEFKEALTKMPEGIVKSRLLEAIKSFENGSLENAKELDFVLPRIKKEFVKTLIEIAKNYSVLLVDVQEAIDKKEAFVDYCHPSQKSNEVIVKELMDYIKIKPKRHSRENKENNISLPEDTYTLF